VIGISIVLPLLLLGCWKASDVRLADINSNGRVGGDDIDILVSQWGQCGTADLDQNGVVGVEDLEILLSEWGT